MDQSNWLKQHSADWLLAQRGFEGGIDNYYPQERLIKFLNVNNNNNNNNNKMYTFLNMTPLQPLHNALFTDGSSKGRAGYLINNQQVTVETPGLSAQLAVLNVFQSVDHAFNLVD